MDLDPNRLIDENEWRDVTERSDLTEEINQPKNYNKHLDRLFGLIGTLILAVIVGASLKGFFGL